MRNLTDPVPAAPSAPAAPAAPGVEVGVGFEYECATAGHRVLLTPELLARADPQLKVTTARFAMLLFFFSLSSFLLLFVVVVFALILILILVLFFFHNY